MKNFFEKYLSAIAAVLILGIGAVSLNGTTAQASLLDVFKNLISPLNQKENTATAPDVSLYKPVIDYEKAVVESVKKSSPAVVSITISKNVPIFENCPVNPFLTLPPEFGDLFRDLPQFTEPCQRGTELKEVGGGSGFLVTENGLIVTNKHVASDTSAAYTVFMSDGRKFDARIVAQDPIQDIAIMKINISGAPTLSFGDSDSVELGQTAIAIGNALGEFSNTVSVGVISGLSRNIVAQSGAESERIEGVLQTDAAINQGNSGGPLLNLKGEVIGINTAVASGAQNIGFAIPINRAKRDVESVEKTGEIQVAYLGVRYTLITPEIAAQEKLSVDYGALVKASQDGPAISPNSPAEKAGLKSGDVILEANGKRIDKDHSLANTISTLKVGDSLSLKILRDGKTLNLNAILEKRPNL